MRTFSIFLSSFLRSSLAAAFSTRAVSFVSRSPRLLTTSLALAAATNCTSTLSSPSYCDSIDLQNDEEISVMPFSQDVLNFDHYNGVTIKVDELLPEHTMDPTLFAQALSKALTIWKAEGRKGIWIRVPTAFSHLIPQCVELGFDFHAAQPGLVVLRQWLPTDLESRLPNGPSHQVGIGAMVVHPHDTKKMLVVQEKTGPAAAKKLWKMPTGLADLGEDISQAAVRELQEETGLKATFKGILAFRQAHRFNGVSDLFFVCLLELENDEHHDTHEAQVEEIAEVAWMPMEEYASQEAWQMSPLYKELNDAMIAAAAQDQPMFVESKHPVGFQSGTNALYISKL